MLCRYTSQLEYQRQCLTTSSDDGDISEDTSYNEINRYTSDVPQLVPTCFDHKWESIWIIGLSSTTATTRNMFTICDNISPLKTIYLGVRYQYGLYSQAVCPIVYCEYLYS